MLSRFWKSVSVRKPFLSEKCNCNKCGLLFAHFSPSGRVSLQNSAQKLSPYGQPSLWASDSLEQNSAQKLSPYGQPSPWASDSLEQVPHMQVVSHLHALAS